MTKKRKHQDDFQKVKLKVGRKKPRVENATDTNFKTKTICLPVQLKEDETLPTNNRKLNIKGHSLESLIAIKRLETGKSILDNSDLLSQMHHYNAGVKQSALLGLKDLLSQYPFTIEAHLSNILNEVTAVFTDKDPNVRAAAVCLLQFLAPKIRLEQITPFFPLVSAHLSSAMTHITEGIQEDSLKVLDILLEEYPALVTGRSSVLLKNFVELISHQQLSKELKNRDTSQSWILSVNPNRRVTSQQWRLNVLARLSKFLQALTYGSSRFGESGDRLQERKDNPYATRNSIYVNWKEHANDQQHIQVYENGGSQPNIHSQFRLRCLVGGAGGLDDSLSSAENLKGFIEIIIPLLIECWIEASPSQFPSSLINPLTSESHQLMEQVLSVISLLWKLSKQHDDTDKMEVWLRKNYLLDFKHHFMSNFPYNLQEIIKHKRKESNKSKYMSPLNNVDHLLLNLTLCDIMVSLANTSTLQKDFDWIEMIRKFVTESFEDGYKLNNKQLNRLLGVTWRLMQIQPNRVATEVLIRAVYTLYQQKNLLVSVRSSLLNFFSSIYQKEEMGPHKIKSKSKVLSRWLASLPLQLAQLGCKNPELSTQLIDIIHAAAARSNKELLNSLQATASRIYDPQEGTVVLLPAASQQRLVQLIYFLPCLPADLLCHLSHCCIMGRLSSNLAAALIRILHMRSAFSGWKRSLKASTMNDVDYFSFLFSTLTGFSAKEMSWLQSIRGNPHISQTQLSPVLLYLTDLDQFLHHWDVTEAVCHNLSIIPARRQCLDVLQSAISKHMAGLSVIPDSTAGSILCVVSKLLDQACVLTDTIYKFLASCCYSLLHFLLTLEKADAEHMRKRDKLWGSCISVLAVLPRVLRLMLQNLQINKTCQEELPVVAQLIRVLLQHGPLRVHMMTNALLVQQIVKDIMTVKSGGTQEQWLTDLHYCFNIYLASRPHSSGAVSTVC